MRVIILPFVFRKGFFTKKARLTVRFLEARSPTPGHGCPPTLWDPRAVLLSLCCVTEAGLWVKADRKLRIMASHLRAIS